jgi:hypothetical protein
LGRGSLKLACCWRACDSFLYALQKKVRRKRQTESRSGMQLQNTINTSASSRKQDFEGHLIDFKSNNQPEQTKHT